MRRLWRGWGAGLLGAALLTVGCAGPPGQIATVALDYRNIDPPPAEVGRLTLDRAVWWTDEQGRLWIGLQRTPQWFGGPTAELALELTLRLEAMPAGAARNYAVNSQSVRARVAAGPLETRFVSEEGVVAIYREGGADRLRGTFRVRVQRYARRLLGTWSGGSDFLIMGEFDARRDAARGVELRGVTDANDWARSVD